MPSLANIAAGFEVRFWIMNNHTQYFQQILNVSMAARGTRNITEQIETVVADSGIKLGLCHVFIHHTSASLIICENADPDVRTDLETFMSQLIPDGDPMFIHTDEGSDDMPAHVRSVLTHTEVTLPVSDSRLALGIWQGVYLWEHRHQAHRRKITVTVHGCCK